MTVHKIREDKPDHTPIGARPHETEDERLLRRSGQTDLQNDEEDKTAAAARSGGDRFATVTRESGQDGDLEDGAMKRAIKKDNETQNTLVDPNKGGGLAPGEVIEPGEGHARRGR